MSSQNIDPVRRNEFIRALNEAHGHCKATLGLNGFLQNLTDSLSLDGKLPLTDLRKLDWETMVQVNRGVLLDGGLGLPNAKEARIGEKDQQAGINIDNPQRFTEMLSSLKPSDLDERTRDAFNALILGCAMSLKKWAEATPRKYFETQLGPWADSLPAHANRLRLPSGVLLAQTIESFRNGYLLERIAVDNCKVLSPKGHFSPSEWHKDSTPEQYQDRWKQVLTVVGALFRENRPQAKRLRDHVVAVIKLALIEAMGDVNEKASDDQIPSTIATKFLQTLETVKKGMGYFLGESK